MKQFSDCIDVKCEQSEMETLRRRVATESNARITAEQRVSQVIVAYYSYIQSYNTFSDNMETTCLEIDQMLEGKSYQEKVFIVWF